MGILSQIKADVQKTGGKIQTSEASQLEAILNKTFYLEKDIDEEVKFVKQVMTRGLETQERTGLHASSIISAHGKYCERQMVLSLHYKQLQGEQVNIGLKKIFEEGNAIHEKWQRLFIRAGYAKACTLDKTRFDDDYMLSYTPDIVCRIPEFFEGVMVCEIKSVNTFMFKKMTSHAEARKQLLLYMHECIKEARRKKKWNKVDYTKGFVLCEDKNTQETKIFLYDYHEEIKKERKTIDRLDSVREAYEISCACKKFPDRIPDCDSYTCKCAERCPMKDACWNKNEGKVKL